MKKIYLVQRPDEKIGWDEYTGAVVAADSPEEAMKMLHAEHDGKGFMDIHHW